MSIDEEKSYYHFLQNLFTEEIYLVSEPDHTTVTKEEVTTPKDQENVPKPLPLIPSKEHDQMVFILGELLPKEVADRFNTMLEKLGLTEHEVNIVYASDYSNEPGFEKELFTLKPDKFVFLGAKKILQQGNTMEDFSTTTINDKSVLILPDFSRILQQKELVLKCWQELQNLLEA